MDRRRTDEESLHRRNVHSDWAPPRDPGPVAQLTGIVQTPGEQGTLATERVETEAACARHLRDVPEPGHVRGGASRVVHTGSAAHLSGTAMLTARSREDHTWECLRLALLPPRATPTTWTRQRRRSYYGPKPWTAAEYSREGEWLAGTVRAVRAGDWGCPELWHEKGLKAVFNNAGLWPNYDLVIPQGQPNSCALPRSRSRARRRLSESSLGIVEMIVANDHINHDGASRSQGERWRPLRIPAKTVRACR